MKKEKTVGTSETAMSESQEHGPKREHREIKSFVLRQSRLTPAQKRAFDLHWPDYGIEFAQTQIDFAALYPKQQPLVLEIGIGNGEALLHAASHDLNRNYLGAEVHRPGVGRLINGAAEAGLRNVRVICHDAVEVLRQGIAAQQLDEVRIYFPDPWHKKRHNKRRLIQTEFVELLISRLCRGGRLHLATDWQHYAEQMLEVCEANLELQNSGGKGQYVDRPNWRIQTHFEKRGVRLGHGVWDLLYQRI